MIRSYLLITFVTFDWGCSMSQSWLPERRARFMFPPHSSQSFASFISAVCLLGLYGRLKTKLKKSAAQNESFSPVHFYSCAVCSDLKGWRLLEQGVTETRMEKRRRDKMVCWPESLEMVWNSDLLFWFVCLFVFGWVRHGCRCRPPEWDMIISLVVSDVFSCCRNLFSWHELLVWLELI